jgi:hypothetical protein
VGSIGLLPLDLVGMLAETMKAMSGSCWMAWMAWMASLCQAKPTPERLDRKAWSGGWNTMIDAGSFLARFKELERQIDGCI